MEYFAGLIRQYVLKIGLWRILLGCEGEKKDKWPLKRVFLFFYYCIAHVDGIT